MGEGFAPWAKIFQIIIVKHFGQGTHKFPDQNDKTPAAYPVTLCHADAT